MSQDVTNTIYHIPIPHTRYERGKCSMTTHTHATRKNNPETVASKVVALTYDGMSRYQILETLDISQSTMSRIMRMHYARSGGSDSKSYKNLQDKMRENTRLAKATANTIHIVETGFILESGLTGLKALLKQYPGRVVMPVFCFNELEKLSERYETANTFAHTPREELDIVPLFPVGDELYVEDSEELPRRIRSVVLLAVDLHILEFDVVIHTNSFKIRSLALRQEAGFQIDLVT